MAHSPVSHNHQIWEPFPHGCASSPRTKLLLILPSSLFWKRHGTEPRKALEGRALKDLLEASVEQRGFLRSAEGLREGPAQMPYFFRVRESQRPERGNKLQVECKADLRLPSQDPSQTTDKAASSALGNDSL